MNKEMKQYTGTKTVKAMPMTMGEAYERKLLKNGVRPSECETDKTGYLVEYEDGYQSWSPADVFEKAYKPSETRLDRLHIECDELRARSKELDVYLNEGLEKVAAEIGRSLAFLLVLAQLPGRARSTPFGR
jgi:hypothetical protein